MPLFFFKLMILLYKALIEFLLSFYVRSGHQEYTHNLQISCWCLGFFLFLFACVPFNVLVWKTQIYVDILQHYSTSSFPRCYEQSSVCEDCSLIGIHNVISLIHLPDSVISQLGLNTPLSACALHTSRCYESF